MCSVRIVPSILPVPPSTSELCTGVFGGISLPVVDVWSFAVGAFEPSTHKIPMTVKQRPTRRMNHLL